MNQRTHSWIAIRAIALLEDTDKDTNLVSLLKPFAGQASVGAWIPDQTDAKRGGNATDNHIFKIEPYNGAQKERFTTDKNTLLGCLGDYRETYRFLKQDIYLDDNWWNSPYKGDVTRPGQHLANRAMALSTMMKDLLLLGNQQIDDLIPGTVIFLKYMNVNARTREEAAAIYFFMLSHFIADSSMPCHCDARKLSGYGEGLHNELESHWSLKVGTYFDKENLLNIGSCDDILDKTRSIDAKFDLDFKQQVIPDLVKGQDVWLELINVCRASFAVASIIAPYKTYKYNDPNARAPFDEVLGDSNKVLLGKVDKAILTDAVLNTAIIWKHIWNKVSKD